MLQLFRLLCLVCGCPRTKTVEVQRLPGYDRKSYVRWLEPKPNCTYTASEENRRTSTGRFPVGESTVTYKYTIGRGLNKQDIESHVHIHVPGMLIKLVKLFNLFKPEWHQMIDHDK